MRLLVFLFLSLGLTKTWAVDDVQFAFLNQCMTKALCGNKEIQKQKKNQALQESFKVCTSFVQNPHDFSTEVTKRYRQGGILV